jgi:catalase
MSDPATAQLLNYGKENKSSHAVATTNGGVPVDNLIDSQTMGPRGPMLMQDVVYLDTIQAFDRERIPERVVHANGAGAFGFFEVTTDEGAKYCKAKMFEKVGKRTPMVARFSTVGGEKGSPDTVRDPRGFALKFYTEEGNWDMVANNTPIFFVRDPMLFPSFIHTQKRNPQTNIFHDPNMYWDFLSLRPESIHQGTFLFSDRGTPDGYRFMNGYGSHTFKNVNEKGEAVWVKYHFKTDQGPLNLEAEKAIELAGADPDYATRDLFNAIGSGDFPSWTMYLQVMPYEEAEKRKENPFDVTLTWSHKEFPLIEVGRFTLNRNPDNYFTDVEQAAYDPSNMIPGIEPSPDKMLQGRLLSYMDAHRHRLGPNYEQLPVNMACKTKVLNYQRDGAMRIYSQGGAPNYYPNSFSGPQPDAKVAWHTDSLNTKETAEAAMMAKRWPQEDTSYLAQTKAFYYNVLDEGGRDRLTTNMAGHLGGAEKFLQERMIQNLKQVDEDYAKRVASKLSNVLKTQPELGVTLASHKKKGGPLNPPRKVPAKA